MKTGWILFEKELPQNGQLVEVEGLNQVGTWISDFGRIGGLSLPNGDIAGGSEYVVGKYKWRPATKTPS